MKEEITIFCFVYQLPLEGVYTYAYGGALSRML